MGNIIDYIREYGDYSFLERPFCDEDSLVIAQLSYLKLDGAVLEPMQGSGEIPGPEDWEECLGVTLGEISHRKRKEEILSDERFARDNAALLEALQKSRRFQTMRLHDCIDRTDPAERLQFFAVACTLEDGSVFLAFRGTDETLVGWKEDFYMACRMPVRSQELSAAYLDEIGSRCRGSLLVGGHSKGGNLAVYAAMYCRETVRSRIRRIYDLDGPGFLPWLCEDGRYEAVKDRIRKIVPHSSVVGMLLEDTAAYEVVESSTFGLLQHNPFSWMIREGRFVTVRDVYKGRKAAVEIVNRWILSLTKEERETFVEELFAVIEASEAETLLDFSGNWKNAVRQMASALQETDRETRKALWHVFRALFIAGKEAASGHGTKKKGNDRMA